jgi:hypothetical protein
MRIDENGEVEEDDLGNVRYFDPAYVHALLLNDLSTMITAEDFSVKNPDGTYSYPAL